MIDKPLIEKHLKEIEKNVSILKRFRRYKKKKLLRMKNCSGK